jgi:hypothetical protein
MRVSALPLFRLSDFPIRSEVRGLHLDSAVAAGVISIEIPGAENFGFGTAVVRWALLVWGISLFTFAIGAFGPVNGPDAPRK